MNHVSVADFESAIKTTYGARARLLAWEIVKEVFPRKTVWEGEVLVFEVLDHPSAHLCYAWEVDGKVMAVLGGGRVDSALAAVRVSRRAPGV